MNRARAVVLGPSRVRLSYLVLFASLALFGPLRAEAEVTNGGFETGDFDGWVSDPTWVVVDHSCGYYSGWRGRWWAWSGGAGETATGKLRSKPFVLDKHFVHVLISGWSSIRGTGEPRRWNYVTLNLEDGTELDRVYAPDTTAFVSAWLEGTGHRGRKVYVEAVDDAEYETYSMLCVDDVRTADLEPPYSASVPGRPQFDPAVTARLVSPVYAVEVDRANGSITRLADRSNGLDLILEPRLAGSFRFALPIPGEEPWQTIEANWIRGPDQRLSSCEVRGRRLTARWDGPLVNYLGEPFDASAAMTIELRDGGVLFGLTIENRTRLPVGEVYFPVIGGVQGLGRTQWQLKTTQMLRPAMSVQQEGASPATTSAPIFRVFANMSPFGDQGPEQYYPYPDVQPEPWVAFHSPRLDRSALLCARDPADRPLHIRLELSPASSGTNRDDGNWPRREELGGLPVGVELSFVDVAGSQPDTTYHAAPVLLRFIDGGAEALRRAYSSLQPVNLAR